MSIKDRMRKVTVLLNDAYGRPTPLKKSDPIDEIVRTILSQNTTDKNSLKAFAVLKESFRSWEGLIRSDTRRISKLIRHAGLANIKAERIKGALKEIGKREGRLSLSSLGPMALDDALTYLRSLKGVGPKTAACVLLFSFGKPVLPVDTHIFRVAKRLGLIAKNADIESAHMCLSAIVPKDLIYNFHLGIIEHGRKTCKAQNPKCAICVLYSMCEFERKRYFRKRGAD